MAFHAQCVRANGLYDLLCALAILAGGPQSRCPFANVHTAMAHRQPVPRGGRRLLAYWVCINGLVRAVCPGSAMPTYAVEACAVAYEAWLGTLVPWRAALVVGACIALCWGFDGPCGG